MNHCDSFFEDESWADEHSNALLITATSLALMTLAPIAAYQLGALDHLPDPPFSIFDSDSITDSKSAHPLGIPDSLLGLGSYGITLALALLAHRDRRVKKLLAVMLVADGSVASFNVVKQVVSFRRLCSWCTGTALCTAAMVFVGRSLIRQEASKLRGML